MIAEGNDDPLLTFLGEFASTPEEERDGAIDALPPEVREELLALAEAREAAAGADLVEVLGAGQGGLEKLYELTQPDDLFAVIKLAAGSHPNIVAEALFAAVVLHRGWGEPEPAVILALREQWHWRVHAQITAARELEDDDQERDA